MDPDRDNQKSEVEREVIVQARRALSARRQNYSDGFFSSQEFSELEDRINDAPEKNQLIRDKTISFSEVEVKDVSNEEVNDQPENNNQQDLKDRSRRSSNKDDLRAIEMKQISKFTSVQRIA